MDRRAIGAAVAAAGLVTGCATGGASPLAEAAGPGSCSRAALQAAVDSYLAAQTAGDASLMALAGTVAYVENRQPADIASGILTRPLDIEFQHSLLDVEQCETFTEIADGDADAPYVLGVHLTVANGAITEIDTLVTTTGDWLFNARNFRDFASEEDWSPIPAAQQDTRETLIAAADAYLDRFSDENAAVPWGYPCRRLEGGAITRGDTCEAGVPLGVQFPIRDYVVDRDIGAVVVLLPFGGEGGLPDSHLFRVENGLLRWVHTITACREGQECPQVPDGGMPPPNAPA